MNPEKLRGLVFGQAIGDALGLLTEFLSRDQVRCHYPKGVHDYGQMLRDRHRSKWQPGEWTDDTDQFLCLLDSQLDNGGWVPSDAAYRLWEWAQEGRGIGRTTLQVVGHSDYLKRPSEVAREFWEASGRSAAPNGALMRTAAMALGPPSWWNESLVEEACHLTHADPRCVSSSLATTVALRVLLLGASEKEAWAKVIQSCESDAATRHVAGKSQEISDLETWKLYDSRSRGYTLKTFAAAMWALSHPTSFEEGLTAIVEQGGDADTNGAVAGAMLGARFGFNAIPRHWVEGLIGREALEKRIRRVLEEWWGIVR